MQNQGALRWSPPEALSPFFRGDVSVALASGVKADEAGELAEKESGKYEDEQLFKDQATNSNSQDAENIICCHELSNINYGDTFAVSFNRNL